MKLTKEQKQARWVALPISMIQRPLRYILNRTTTKNENGEKVLDKRYHRARLAACVGLGEIVKQMAFEIK